MAKGRLLYVPGCMVEELDEVMKQTQLKKKSKALVELAKYSRVGREAEKIIKLRF